MANLFTRSKEQSTLILFFLHNFFISIGTVLVYVSANIILLENHPEFSLPIAYILSTLAMMGVGKVYEYYEHHYLLQKLSSRVLLAVLMMSLLMGLIVYLSHSIFTAVGIMVGFRIIYLLVNLEFWGVSAVVFDVRQSKRIFSVIGSGDVPAKAIGAILTVLIHSTSVLAILISVAFVMFLLAFFTQKRTLQLTEMPEAQPERKIRKDDSKFIQQLFGGNRLIYEMCIGLVAVSLSATWIEYNFFVNVKYKFHSQHDVIAFVGYMLAITYSISTIVKLLLSSKVIDRFGLRNALLFLPVGTVIISATLVVLSSFRNDETSLLIDFSAAYLLFEVMRRTMFDPVFLVMFQPLSTHQRLKGHTLAKGFYEPLGMGIAGLLLYAEYYFDFSFTWIHFGFTVLSAFIAFYYLSRAFRHYIMELKTALSKRFLSDDELVMQKDAFKAIIKNLKSEKPEEVISAIDWITRFDAPKLDAYLANLLQHSSENVRIAALRAANKLEISAESIKILSDNIATEPNAICRQLGGQILSKKGFWTEEKINEYLTSDDLALTEGILTTTLATPNKIGKQQLEKYCLSGSSLEQKQVALRLIKSLKLSEYEIFVSDSLSKTELQPEAIKAAGSLATKPMIVSLTQLLFSHSMAKRALKQLINIGEEGFLTISSLKNTDDTFALRKLISFCEKYQTEDSRKLLFYLIENKNWEVSTAALKALGNFEKNETHRAFFEQSLEHEFKHVYQLLNGFDSIPKDTLQYELDQTSDRIFYILTSLYDRDIVQDAMQGVEHSSKEKRANALEILDNIIPREIYKCLHALLDDSNIEQKKSIFGEFIGKNTELKSIISVILDKGERYFGNWTIAQALQAWKPAQNKFSLGELSIFEAYLNHPNSLIKEAAFKKLTDNEVCRQQPEFEKYIKQIDMSHSHEKATVSELERVIVLKNTQLFAETPENVLTSIVPIMKEISFQEGKTIFKKGEIGNCMYIIYAGEIGIYDHETLLATFTKGDVFGELALLDAEPRSASAVVESDVLLFRIDQEDFFDLMEERNELLRSVLRILCQRIRTQNDKIRRLS
ncbi:MAG: cyclic nucleotide-binding domain-containing protein [Emticicia sp.]|uniref:cyclic nucleotide-binding domain-containing protein n=1 Tax=Emticicia sp. TaxID=1930953 RepID=UPI003BA66C71